MNFQILIILIFIFGNLACNQVKSGNIDTKETTVQTPDSASQPENIDVNLEFKVDNLKEKKPKIIGKTNLPNGTKLSVSIAGIGNNSKGQENVLINNGGFEVSNFSKNKVFSVGQYSVEISTVPAKMQTPEIRRIIGENGEKLIGSAVKKDAATGNIVTGKLIFVLN